ncbi:hypothetical protein [Dyadobacter sp. CY343]|uniref:hypothetical protein n=1 Tax=Dyadobacter sp. CY343 TaxID=2907299 RepID=UPI001F26FF49|nr:hypothetical protein [Dyadobacter sp. CY343]MCE7062371.1 hypothetical protein [Dyadobacter sp. CY343]
MQKVSSDLVIFLFLPFKVSASSSACKSHGGGLSRIIQSLKMIHDLALYHSDIPFDQAKKSALFDLKVLWEGLEQMGRKLRDWRTVVDNPFFVAAPK